MAWTYSSSPSTVNRDAVRLLTGQTSSSDDVLLYDADITYALAQTPSVELAAAKAADMLAARYSVFPSQRTIGQLGITYGDRAKQLRDMAATIRKSVAFESVTPFVGGTSVADKQAREQNSDRPSPFFKRGQMDNPNVTWDNSTAST